MRNRFNYLSYFLSKEDRPFGRATGADHTTAARVCYEEVMTAFFTPNPRHFSLRSMQALPVLWNATLEKGVNCLHHFCPQVAVFLFKLVRITPLKFLEIAFDNPIVIYPLRMTPVIYPLECLRHNRWQKPEGYQ